MLILWCVCSPRVCDDTECVRVKSGVTVIKERLYPVSGLAVGDVLYHLIIVKYNHNWLKNEVKNVKKC